MYLHCRWNALGQKSPDWSKLEQWTELKVFERPAAMAGVDAEGSEVFSRFLV